MQEFTPSQVEEMLGDGKQVALPSLSEISGVLLGTQGIEDDLSQEKVSNILLKKDSNLEVPCYLIDFRNTKLSLQALKTLRGLLPSNEKGSLSEEDSNSESKSESESGEKVEQLEKPEQANVALYIWGNDANDKAYLNKIGYGTAYNLYAVIETLIPAVYGDTVKVYKNLGKGLIEAGSMDVSSVILDI